MGIALFNEQYFFDAHDAWEDLWADTRNEDRLFYQSLIHATVALYHWRNDNKKGARNVFGYFQKRVVGYPDVHHGLHLGKLKAELEALFARLETDRWDASKAPKMETEGLEIPPAQPVEEM
jgi:predicted metal-dependent hydrolase